jgi:hypothetical protein
MKPMRFCAAFVLTILTAVGAAQAADNPPTATPPATPSTGGPMITVDSTTYDFGKIQVGEKARHTYLITNTGTEELLITNVHPGCHCTTAGDWTHKIEPGMGGIIPVQFDSTGFGGPITRTIEVYSNAKNKSHETLFLKGTIWKPLDYASSTFLNIPADSTNEVTTSVRIVNQTDHDVVFSNAVCPNHLFTGLLKEIKPGKEYQLEVTAHPPFPAGNTSGNFTIDTSLAGTPHINITAMARVTPAIQVSPSQVYLNPQKDRATTNRVMILANTTNALVLSNPKASDSQVQVEIQKGARPGMYNIMIVTPVGYHLDPGQRMEVSVESNHPRYPVIKIPVMQYPSPKPFKAAQANLPKTPPQANVPKAAANP